MGVSVPPQGTYQIDPVLSRIEFGTKHMFGLGGVKGSFTLRQGTITIAEPLIASTVHAVVDATSIDTKNSGRDKKVKSKSFLHTAQHAEITFLSSAAEQTANGWVLYGTLTARGQSAPLDLAVIQAAETADGVSITATATVDRYAHSITAMKGMAGRHLDFTITAIATRA